MISRGPQENDVTTASVDYLINNNIQYMVYGSPHHITSLTGE